ncbi:MAG: quinolinate synthase NadA [Bacteroidetes bacterium]|nr:quinolinate synthase NadA [Bacteroidota bacterium]MCL5025701.1 quinolinate synthase NadA [Chloroflexota bacterium]
MRDIEGMRQRIQHLKETRQAVIVAHNYQWPEVQDVADFVGDSLELARKTATLDNPIIVFCGVHFMAESAAILNPTRRVLLAESTAGCPMAEMIDVDTLRQWKAQYPDAAVVAYVNSSAAVKAESNVCCTSANAVKVVDALREQRILFVPDRNLGAWIAKQTRKEIIIYPGFCITHFRVKPEHILAAKQAHPGAVVVVHPECRPEVTAIADAVLSTSQMGRYVKASPAREFIIGTEEGLIHRLRQQNPDKAFFAASTALLCPNMKKTTLESVVSALEMDRYHITVEPELAARARRALDRMLEIV